VGNHTGGQGRVNSIEFGLLDDVLPYLSLQRNLGPNLGMGEVLGRLDGGFDLINVWIG
jgi:hypothetical protein